MTRILCLWLPNWAIQRVIRSRPELRGRPAALVVARPRGSEVAACCGRAVAQGVRPGMPLAEAQALVRDLGVAAYQPAADRQALVKLAEACERFSPRVAVEEGEEPESLLLDITNLEHLYGSEAKLAAQVKDFFMRRGYRVRLAVADTVGAAWARVHFKECPIEALRISDDIIALLRQLGIETIDQLLALPREELVSRFGGELLRRLDQWAGRGRELIEPQRGLPALEVSYALEEPTGERDVLIRVIEQLVEQLSRQLAARNQGAVVLMCLLHYARPKAPSLLPKGVDKDSVPLRIGLLQPSANARQLLELVELHLENVRLIDEVERVEVRTVVTGRLGERQRELFVDRWSSDPHPLAVLVNRLSSRLGEERVLRVELRKSAAPERSVAWKPVVGKEWEKGRGGEGERSRKIRSPTLPLSHSPALSSRPLLLHPEPQATEVVCIAPDGPPQFVWMKKHRERIVGCVGPERIETLWWRGPSMRRDYYRVATQSGSHLWMFRRLADGKWFVHGEFA